MIPFKIDTNKNLNELYSELCITHREQQKLKDGGLWECYHCGIVEKGHGPGNRCTNYTITTVFRSHNQSFLESVNKALDLIDQLKEL